MGHGQEVEGAPLQRGWGGGLGECWQIVGGLDEVGADGGQVGDQAGEAVHRCVVFGAFARCLLQRFVGALSGRDGVGAFGGGGFVVVLKRIGARACFMCQLM